MSNRRTKLRDNKKSPGNPGHFERKPLKEREKDSLKDREKTDDNIFNKFNIISTYLKKTDILKLQTLGFILRDYNYQHNDPKDLKRYLSYLISELLTIYEKL